MNLKSLQLLDVGKVSMRHNYVCNKLHVIFNSHGKEPSNITVLINISVLNFYAARDL